MRLNDNCRMSCYTTVSSEKICTYFRLVKFFWQILMGSKINWVCLACTADAPISLYAVPTSCERETEYMNKGDRSVCCFSQFFSPAWELHTQYDDPPTAVINHPGICLHKWPQNVTGSPCDTDTALFVNLDVSHSILMARQIAATLTTEVILFADAVDWIPHRIPHCIDI